MSQEEVNDISLRKPSVSLVDMLNARHLGILFDVGDADLLSKNKGGDWARQDLRGITASAGVRKSVTEGLRQLGPSRPARPAVGGYASLRSVNSIRDGFTAERRTGVEPATTSLENSDSAN